MELGWQWGQWGGADGCDGLVGSPCALLASFIACWACSSLYQCLCFCSVPPVQRLRDYDAKLVAEAEEHAHFEVRQWADSGLPAALAVGLGAQG